MDIHVPIHSWVEKGEPFLALPQVGQLAFLPHTSSPSTQSHSHVQVWTYPSSGIILISLLDIKQRACLATLAKLVGFSLVLCDQDQEVMAPRPSSLRKEEIQLVKKHTNTLLW